MRVYLSGPISDQAFKTATTWRDNAAAFLLKLGLTPLDPLRGKSFLSSQKKIEREIYEAMHNPILSDKALFSRDHQDVETADVVLVNLTEAKKVSIGTMFELAWAAHLRKLTVIAMGDGNVHDHPFVRESGIIFPTVEEALDYIASCRVDMVQ